MGPELRFRRHIRRWQIVIKFVVVTKGSPLALEEWNPCGSESLVPECLAWPARRSWHGEVMTWCYGTRGGGREGACQPVESLHPQAK